MPRRDQHTRAALPRPVEPPLRRLPARERSRRGGRRRAAGDPAPPPPRPPQAGRRCRPARRTRAAGALVAQNLLRHDRRSAPVTPATAKAAPAARGGAGWVRSCLLVGHHAHPTSLGGAGRPVGGRARRVVAAAAATRPRARAAPDRVGPSPARDAGSTTGDHQRRQRRQSAHAPARPSCRPAPDPGIGVERRRRRAQRPIPQGPCLTIPQSIEKHARAPRPPRAHSSRGPAGPSSTPLPPISSTVAHSTSAASKLRASARRPSGRSQTRIAETGRPPS